MCAKGTPSACGWFRWTAEKPEAVGGATAGGSAMLVTEVHCPASCVNWLKSPSCVDQAVPLNGPAELAPGHHGQHPLSLESWVEPKLRGLDAWITLRKAFNLMSTRS